MNVREDRKELYQMSKKSRRRRPYPAPKRSAIIWFMGVVVVGMLALLLFLTGHVTVLTGQRLGPGRAFQGTLQNSFLMIIPLGTTQLPGLREAKLERVVSSGNKPSVAYRVLFVTDAGVIPMTSFARGGRDRHQELVDRINAHLLDQTADSFSVRQVGAGWFALVPATAVLILLIVLAIWLFHVARRAFGTVSSPRIIEKTPGADASRGDRGA
jgi:hypothetical protein